MRIRCLRTAYLALVCVSFAQPALGNGAPAKVVAYDAARLLGSLAAGEKFEIDIALKSYEASESNRLVKYWGTDGSVPGRVIEHLVVKVSGREIEVPEKVFSDLADVALPAGVYLMETPEAVQVHLRGGDGSGAYTAILKIVGGRVVSRRIEFVGSDGERDSTEQKYLPD